MASAGSLLRAGRAGASRDEWILEALQELKHEESVDRVGVWLEERASGEGREGEPVLFRGDVWEEGIGIGMPEWTRISGDAPLPMGMLCAGRSCEYGLEGPNQGPILGPLVELQRVLWIPVLGRRTLRGLVMMGTRQRQKALPRMRAEQVAEELGLLLEFEEERRLAAARKADLELVQRMRRLEAAMMRGPTASTRDRWRPCGGRRWKISKWSAPRRTACRWRSTFPASWQFQ